MKIPPKFRKSLEWLIPISILGTLYFTGLWPEVAGGIQSLIVRSGLVNPSIERAEEFGSLSTEFTLETIDGNFLNSKDLEGKTVFVNLWATWCPPCIAELPDIENLYKELKDEQNIEFVMLNLDQNRDKALKFISRKNLNLPVYFKASALPSELMVRSIPTTFVIDPFGKIIFKHSGIASYNNPEFKSFLKAGPKGKNS
jgi:thiol-disulfide isomerase/thioredoxin